MKAQFKRLMTAGVESVMGKTSSGKTGQGLRDIRSAWIRMMGRRRRVTEVIAPGKEALQGTGERMVVGDDMGVTRRIEENGVIAKGQDRGHSLHKNIEVRTHNTITDHPR